ncbi:hypothetical protein T07_7457 [Trichinella nelsoni]|uniref:Uncharacterized protein n=1 Tax=Trichinella nelsoni TaxID=6336 RepID=A0A0V0RIM7_9BILA|nr:hypothetical protein T07_7457 [Trichinella nelsoni]
MASFYVGFTVSRAHYLDEESGAAIIMIQINGSQSVSHNPAVGREQFLGGDHEDVVRTGIYTKADRELTDLAEDSSYKSKSSVVSQPHVFLTNNLKPNVSGKIVVAGKLVDCSLCSGGRSINNDYLAAIRATFVSERDTKQDK